MHYLSSPVVQVKIPWGASVIPTETLIHQANINLRSNRLSGYIGYVAGDRRSLISHNLIDSTQLNREGYVGTWVSHGTRLRRCHPRVDSDPEQDTYTCSVSPSYDTAPMSHSVSLQGGM